MAKRGHERRSDRPLETRSTWRVAPPGAIPSSLHPEVEFLLLAWSAGLVVDLGCGTGGSTRELMSATNHVVGVDINAEAVADAALSATGNLSFMCADAEA